jgi:hypothetical protein
MMIECNSQCGELLQSALGVAARQALSKPLTRMLNALCKVDITDNKKQKIHGMLTLIGNDEATTFILKKLLEMAIAMQDPSEKEKIYALIRIMNPSSTILTTLRLAQVQLNIELLFIFGATENICQNIYESFIRALREEKTDRPELVNLLARFQQNFHEGFVAFLNKNFMNILRIALDNALDVPKCKIVNNTNTSKIVLTSGI